MISKKAVEDFLNRKLDHFAWIKKCDKNKIMETLESIGDLQFKTDPYAHQLACVYLGLCFPGFAFFLDMGLGKTKLSLDIFNNRYLLGETTRALVVVPNWFSVEGWMDEIEIHTDLTGSALIGSKEERLEALEEDSQLCVINYDGLPTMMATLQKKKGKKGKAWVPDDKKVRHFCKQFDFLIMDELHKCKNKESLTFRLCNRLSKSCKYRYGLTGTPFGRDPQDLWAQMYLMDRGETLGQTLGIYRACFFNEKQNFWGGSEYTFKKGMRHKLHSTLQHRSIRYSDSECFDIPPIIKQVIHIPMSEETKPYYEQTRSGVLNAGGDRIEIENGYIKLRQISSSFIYFKDEDGEKTTIDFVEHPKIDKLISMLDEVPEGSSSIIFYEFSRSGELIYQALKKAKKPCLYMKKEEASAIRKRFGKDDQSRILLVNWRSGGTGLNLQAATRGFFYESPVSPIERKQCEKRFTGARQKKKTWIYDLCVKGSIEQSILDFLKEGEDLFTSIIGGKVKLKKIL